MLCIELWQMQVSGVKFHCESRLLLFFNRSKPVNVLSQCSSLPVLEANCYILHYTSKETIKTAAACELIQELFGMV